ncbi:hypothetical protein A1O1_05332 [Capronia coronata CBS 617.96]|uniref:Uncharacterized protein n=1 Tax=Capronia coronata CBS 617.96 TaxID=1182541 RepID=W9Y6F1_9EURO|nr:uncharacterized protein A1O1_05332 [Capronia coronata CBS 617.96]EXJ88402.1 hypothetical protein A1O1_05332 [Capronia coronata CBS 617.96]
MLFVKAALGMSSLILLASAQEPVDAVHKTLIPGLSKVSTTTSKLMSRSLDKRCSGSCEECFGTGYTLCPESSLYCYLPGDVSYGLDSCPGFSSGSSGTASASAAAATSTSSSTGTDDVCSQTGATCASCFGSSYLECPDGVHCYDPSDPQFDTCPDDDSDSGSSGTGGSTGSGGTSSTSACESQFGAGSIPCGTDACYNPDEGDVCCQDGYHCEGGDTCSSIVGKCCPAGSTSSSCSGSGSGSGSGSSSSSGLGGTLMSTSSYATALPTSGDSIDTESATSTRGFLVTTGSTRTTASAATGSTGSTGSTSGSGTGPLPDARALMVAVGLGALVL